jgi:mRNA-capping enzyme
MASPQREPDKRGADSAAERGVHADGDASSGQKSESDRSRERSRRGGRRSGPVRRSKLSVPDNWDDVPKIGSLVASSRFVAMRVPLDDKFTRMIRSPEELWTPEIFLETQASVGHDVRMLIDLTNTTKYYDGEAVFHGSGVQYVKLCIEGFKAPPRESEVVAFLRIVDEFLAAEPHGSIAVHCTHGLNRTGYLVVSYLVQRAGMSVQDALKAFSDARPPGLIKHMYVEDLFRRFAPDATVELPELPAWATAKYAARRG